MGNKCEVAKLGVAFSEIVTPWNDEGHLESSILLVTNPAGSLGAVQTGPFMYCYGLFVNDSYC